MFDLEVVLQTTSIADGDPGSNIEYKQKVKRFEGGCRVQWDLVAATQCPVPI